MSRRLDFFLEARKDLREASAWYAQTAGRDVAREFRRAVQSATRTIIQAPLRFPLYEGDVRNFVMDRYPYNIYYLVTDADVVIVSVFHQRRDPDEWRRRL